MRGRPEEWVVRSSRVIDEARRISDKAKTTMPPSLGYDPISTVQQAITALLRTQESEFIAIGTAIKHREGELHRAPNGRPFTSDLSGQDSSHALTAGLRMSW